MSRLAKSSTLVHTRDLFDQEGTMATINNRKLSLTLLAPFLSAEPLDQFTPSSPEWMSQMQISFKSIEESKEMMLPLISTTNTSNHDETRYSNKRKIGSSSNKRNSTVVVPRATSMSLKMTKLSPLNSQEAIVNEKVIPIEKTLRSLQKHPDNTEKHSKCLEGLVRTREAWFMSEMPQIKELVHQCLCKVEITERTEYIQALYHIIEICSKSLMLRNSADQFIRLDSYLELFSCFGLIFKVNGTGSLELKARVLTTISILVKSEALQDIVHDLLSIPTLVDALDEEVSGLALSFHEPSDYFQLLIKVVRQMTLYSSFCDMLSEKDTLSVLASIIERVTSFDNLYNDMIDVIWNMIEQVPSSRRSLCTMETIQVLYSTIHASISNGFRLKDKELRNDILLLSSYLAQETSAQPLFLESGFLDYLCYRSVSNEQEGVSIDVKQTNSEENFEMKKIMWNILFFLSFNSECLTSIIENNFVKTLIHYLDDDFIRAGTAISLWNQNQLIELQLLSLKMLFYYCVQSNDEFAQNNGYRVCLKIAESTNQAELFTASMSVLLNACTTPLGIEYLSKEKTLETMLEIATNSSLPIYCRSDALHIISSLCNNDDHNKTVFHSHDGTTKLLSLFESDRTQDDILIVLIDCVWSCILSDENSEQQFVSHDGLYKLIKVLEYGGQVTQLSLLSLLIEFMNLNNSIVDEVGGWKSVETNLTLPQLLIRLWNSVYVDSEISQLDDSGEFPVQTNSVVLTPTISSLIPAFNLELKRRIYHMFRLLGQDRSFDSLSKDDRITLETILQFDNYLIEGEWNRICKELEEEQIRPTTPDQLMIDEVFHNRKQREEQKQMNIAAIESNDRSQKSQEESKFYDTLQINKKEKKTFTTGLSVMEIKLRRAKMLNNSSTMNLSEPVLDLKALDLKKGETWSATMLTTLPGSSIREKIAANLQKSARN